MAHGRGSMPPTFSGDRNNNPSRSGQQGDDFTTGGSGRIESSKPGSSAQRRTTSDPPDYEKETRYLVNELKEKLQNRSASERSRTKEELIEQEVSRIRRERNPEQLIKEQWKRKISKEYSDCPSDVLSASMAYGNDPDEVKKVIEAKINKKKSSSTDATSSDESDDKLPKEMVSALQSIDKKLRTDRPPNLFEIILHTEEDHLDRADRLFYSEGCRILGSSENYTFENAHDQVQAIRMMNYKSDSDEELRSLINKYRTFDDAYHFLGKCVRNKMEQRSTNQTNPSKPRPGSGAGRSVRSIVQNLDLDPSQSSNDDPKSPDPTFNQSAGLMNSQSGDPNPRYSLRNRTGAGAGNGKN